MYIYICLVVMLEQELYCKASANNVQWRNYYGLRPGVPGGPQPQWGPPGLGDRAKTLARASDMLQCRFLTIRIL